MSRRIRWVSVVGLWAQVVFVVSWLVAQSWQGPRYRPVAHTISDMYADGAPHGWFLVLVLTLTGAATVVFALAGVRPALRAAGWTATVAAVLLAVSIFGLGDLLTLAEREGCRLADPGCTPAAQLTAGGRLDGLLSTVGLFVFVAAGFFLASAMAKLPDWRGWRVPVRVATAVFLVLLLALGVLSGSPVAGLLERVVAAAGAAGLAVLAVGVRRRPTTTHLRPPERAVS